MQWCQIVTFERVQCHPGLTYIFNFWPSGTLALRAERQSARRSEIKDVGYTWMAKCNQLTALPFKGLTFITYVSAFPSLCGWNQQSAQFTYVTFTHTHDPPFMLQAVPVLYIVYVCVPVCVDAFEQQCCHIDCYKLSDCKQAFSQQCQSPSVECATGTSSSRVNYKVTSC